jgi:hypothetical protein
VLWLELSPDKAAGMRTIYTTLGLALIVTIPLAFLIPDAARERRQATLAKAAVAKAAVRDQTADGSRASAEEEPASVSGLPPSRGAI